MTRVQRAVIGALCWYALIHGSLGFCEESLRGFSDVQLESLAAESYNKGNPGSATVYLDEVLRRNPENLGARSSRGRMKFDLGQLGPALEDLSFVVARLESGQSWPGVTPDHVVHHRAFVLQGLKRLPEALSDVERALTINPSYDNAWNTKGNILRDMGRSAEAIDAFQRGLKVNPRHLPMRINVVHLAILEKEYEVAISLCEESRDVAASSEASMLTGDLETGSLAQKVPVNPTPSLLFWNCAQAYKDTGDSEKASEFFGLAASAPARTAEDFLYRAQAKQELDQHDAALVDYAEALSRDNSLVTAHEERGSLLIHLKRYEEAQRAYGEYADRFPGDLKPIKLRAAILLKLKRIDEFLPLAEKVIGREPNNADFLVMLGMGHADKEEAAQAEAFLREVVELSPNHAIASQVLFSVLLSTKQYEAALQLMDHLEAKQGKPNPLFASIRARCLGELKRFDESLKVLNEALAQRPNDVDLLTYRAWIYRVQGDADAALRDISKAAELQPTNDQIRQYQEEYLNFQRYTVGGAQPGIFSVGLLIGTIFREALREALRKGE
jgi:tetratricopeptide (TPR) repeat protein